MARQKPFESKELVGPAPRFPYPASTSFIQNNHLRLYRYALGDQGTLVYDTEHLAHYDSDSLSIQLSGDFLRTEALERETPDLKLDQVPKGIGPDAPASIRFRAPTGCLRVEVTQAAGDAGVSVVAVRVDGLEAGRYTADALGRLHSLPLFVHGDREHVVELQVLEGPGHRIDGLRVIPNGLRTRTVKQAGLWNDSHEELQHRVTRGVGGYEYGEWLYPTCYFDMDKELLSEFPAGIGHGFPQPLNMDLTAEQGAYLLVVGAKARIGAGSLISVAINPDADMQKAPDYVPMEWFRYAGEYEVPPYFLASGTATWCPSTSTCPARTGFSSPTASTAAKVTGSTP